LIEQLKDFIRDVGSPVEERITIEIEEVKASMDQEFSILKNEIDKLEDEGRAVSQSLAKAKKDVPPYYYVQNTSKKKFPRLL
jgi:archaellum component FlaC